MRRMVAACHGLICAAALVSTASAAEPVGRQPDGSVTLASGQAIAPYGRTTELAGTPTAIALSPDQATLAVHGASDAGPALALIDLATGKVTKTAGAAAALSPLTGSSGGVNAYGPDGLLWAKDGDRLFASDAAGGAVIAVDRELRLVRRYALPDAAQGGSPVPEGLSLDGETLVVASSRANRLDLVDLRSGAVRSTPVGRAPHGVTVVDGVAWVANEGGRTPTATDLLNPSGGAGLVADPFTGAAATGTVTAVDVRTARRLTDLDVGLHPTAVLADGARVWVAATNSDQVTAIDTRRRRILRTFAVRPRAGLPVGLFATGLARVPRGRLAVSLGRANAVALYDVRELARRAPRFMGLVPTAGYPSGVVYARRSGRMATVATEGVGSLRDADARRQARTVVGQIGAVTVSKVPSGTGARRLAAKVAALNHWGRSVAARLPAAITHAVLIIRENRTYDSVLGDLGRGDGDPSLTQFGEPVTPNAHALARDFPLLDRFFTAGRRSFDGHQWALQGTGPDYFTRLAGSTVRADAGPPDSGHDSLLYAPGGFLHENALRHGKSFLDFGEYTLYNDLDTTDGARPATSDKPSLSEHLVPEYPGFQLEIPDQRRSQIFRAHLDDWSAGRGSMPDLTIMILPNDHTLPVSAGGVAPSSFVADNDLALGQIVEAVSRSPFWPSTAIFVEEDDAQDGTDHVDGHRAPAFVISPWARRDGAIVSTSYGQLDVLRTIEQLLGLPPMGPLDASAKVMSDVFADRADLRPYTAVTPSVSLTGRFPGLLSPLQRAWAAALPRDLTETADEADPALMNRATWYATRGWDEPYPGDATVLYPSEVARTGR